MINRKHCKKLYLLFQFTEMVTIPMIQTIYFLEKQREMLCNLLKKKDLELEQYRLEKDLISRSKF